MSIPYLDDLVKLASQSLTKPEDFGYWGPEDTFVTWGFAGIDKHNASDILEESNFEVITKDLMTRFPDDFRIESYHHWAVGNIERLVCRVLKNGSEITIENITDAFKEAINWHKQLKDYPVADEDHFSDMEYLESIRMIKDSGYLLEYIDTTKDGWAEDVYHELTSNMNLYFTPGCSDIKDDDIIEAVYNLQLWNSENSELWNDWTDRNNREPIKTRKVSKEQLKLFDDN